MTVRSNLNLGEGSCMTFLLVNILLSVAICGHIANAVVCLRENNDLYMMDHVDNRIPITQPGESHFCTGDLILLQKSFQANDDNDGDSEEDYLPKSNQEDSFERYWTTGYGFHSHYEHLPAPPPVPDAIKPNMNLSHSQQLPV